MTAQRTDTERDLAGLLSAASAAAQVKRVPFDELRGWLFAPHTGDLVHESGGFFAVRGLCVEAGQSPVRRWSQPILDQPETGILGLLLRDLDGEPHCLVQAKVEPGNVSGAQLSPTVQATRSNYSRLHRGAPTRYLEYFTTPGLGRVLVDVLQSEQGSWFWHKRNRNIVVHLPPEAPEVPTAEGYRWVALSRLRGLLHHDNLINMDARSVLSNLSFHPALSAPGGHRAPGGAACLVEASAALRWLGHARDRYRMRARTAPLGRVTGWHRTATEIAHDEGGHFRIIGVQVAAEHREVRRWHQPLLSPCARGLVAFLARHTFGTVHLLCRARPQQGYWDGVEIGPTVQTSQTEGATPRPAFLDDVLGAPPGRVRYDTLQSEEGGRFHHAVNRYLVIEADDELAATPPPEGFRWISAPALAALSRSDGHVNVEARTLLACLPDLWSSI